MPQYFYETPKGDTISVTEEQIKLMNSNNLLDKNKLFISDDIEIEESTSVRTPEEKAAFSKANEERMQQEIVEARTAQVKEDNPLLSAMFPRTADEIGKGNINTEMEPLTSDRVSYDKGSVMSSDMVTEEQPSISGKTMIDYGTLPGRAYVAAADAIGGDVPFTESLAETQAAESLPWYQSIPENVLRDDPTILVPGSQFKNLKMIPRALAKGAQEVAIEGTRQALEGEYDVGNLMVAGAAPVGLEALGAAAKGVAKSRLQNRLPSSDADLLLNEKLVPVTGGDAGIADEVAKRISAKQQARTEGLNQGAEQFAQSRELQSQAGNISLEGDLRTAINQFDEASSGIRESGINYQAIRGDANSNITQLEDLGSLNSAQAAKARDIIDSEMNDMIGFTERGGNKISPVDELYGPAPQLSNRSDRWYYGAGLDKPNLSDAQRTPEQLAYKQLWESSNKTLPSSEDIIALRDIQSNLGNIMSQRPDMSWEGMLSSNPAINISNAASQVAPAVVDRSNLGGIMMGGLKQTEDELNP
jgi:hypothetical protein